MQILNHVGDGQVWAVGQESRRTGGGRLCKADGKGCSEYFPPEGAGTQETEDRHRSIQVDYILCQRSNLKEISDFKEAEGESVARQHKMAMCRMTLVVRKMKTDGNVLTGAKSVMKRWKYFEKLMNEESERE